MEDSVLESSREDEEEDLSDVPADWEESKRMAEEFMKVSELSCQCRTWSIFDTNRNYILYCVCAEENM